MTLAPQKLREIVFQLLYSYDLGQPTTDDMVELIMHQLTVSKRNVRLAQERVEKLKSHLNELDQLIASVSQSYDFHRIQTVTKNILRLGVFELFFTSDIPPKVAIAEAMRLARKFGSPESAGFVNALLDHLYRLRQGEQTDVQAVSQYAEEVLKSEQLAEEIAKQQPPNEPDF